MGTVSNCFREIQHLKSVPVTRRDLFSEQNIQTEKNNGKLNEQIGHLNNVNLSIVDRHVLLSHEKTIADVGHAQRTFEYKAWDSV